MTIKEMHIGLDLILQRINSNVYGRILPEEKDWFLNKVTKDLVRGVLLDEKNTVMSIIAYGDIRGYYETLQYYIRTVELSVNQNKGKKFVYGDFPVNIPMGVIKSGVLYKGIPYKILVTGTTDFTDAGYSTGNSFVCNPDNLIGGDSIVVGETYRIINAAGVDFITFGAKANDPGTVFTATTGGVIATTGGVNTTNTNVSVEVERITFKPTWAGSTEITPTSNFGYFNYVESSAIVRYGQSISSGSLTIGKQYIVYTAGTTDLSSVGGKVINDKGFIFTCTADSTIAWDDTVLYEVLEAGTRLVKAQDINNFLTHSFGTTVSSPVATINDNKVNVYHDFHFDISRVYLTYVKEPVSVSMENNIDSDLPVSLHSMLVDATAEFINQAKGQAIQNDRGVTDNRQ